MSKQPTTRIPSSLLHNVIQCLIKETITASTGSYYNLKPSHHHSKDNYSRHHHHCQAIRHSATVIFSTPHACYVTYRSTDCLSETTSSGDCPMATSLRPMLFEPCTDSSVECSLAVLILYARTVCFSPGFLLRNSQLLQNNLNMGL